MKGVGKGTGVVVFALILIALYFGGSFGGLWSAQAGCQDIYAYYKAYRCCDETVTSLGSPALQPLAYGAYWVCPGYASKCEVRCEEIPHDPWQTQYVWAKGTDCTIGLFGLECAEFSTMPEGVYNYIEKNQHVYHNWVSPLILDYKIYDGFLCDCQLNPCGAPCPTVPGASGCGFSTTDDMFETNGITEAIGTNLGFGIYYYTVPINYCYVYYPETNRHPIGNTCEACTDTSDCANNYPSTYFYEGKNFGAVCSGSTVELYDCMATGSQVCTDFRDANGNNIRDANEECLSWGQQSRCDIYRSLPVQCCPGTSSCGPQMFCDGDYTCKPTAQCTTDTDCGVVVQCDYTTTELKTPACIAGACTFRTEDVECCSDVNCAEGYYCDYPDYTCKKKPDDKEPCPYECCQGEVAYFDRPCAPEKPVCCGDNICAVDAESCGIPPAPEEFPHWIWIPIMGVLFALIGYLRAGYIGVGIGGIIGGLIGYVMFWVFSLAWWQQLLLGAGLVGGGVLIVYLGILAIPLIILLLSFRSGK